MINIEDIAQVFKVYDTSGREIHSFLLLGHDDLITATTGRRIDDVNEIDETVQIIKSLVSFDIGPAEILWYTPENIDKHSDDDFANIGTFAVDNQAKLVIIE